MTVLKQLLIFYTYTLNFILDHKKLVISLQFVNVACDLISRSCNLAC